MPLDSGTRLGAYEILGPLGAHAVRGERDEAFRWLDRAFELHDSGIAFVPVNWSLENLHSDPRWPRLLEKIGLSR